MKVKVTAARSGMLALKLNLGVFALAAVFAASTVRAAEKPILIGEISSYSALPVGAEAYRKGWQLAVEEINQAGCARPAA
jgi:hypothetical protein